MADVELNSIGNGDGTNYLVRDNTKIPLSGSNQISGDLIPATDNAYNLGDSTYGFASFYTNKIYLKGNTIFNVADDNYICVGGATAQANGANLVLNGKNRSTSTGEFKLEARDGTNTKQLIGKPNGTLSWSGTSIVPTANGTCDLGSASYRFRDVYASPRSGIHSHTRNDDFTIFSGGLAYNDASTIWLYSELYSVTSLQGVFQINAKLGSTTKTLQGKPDGTLTWNNKNLAMQEDVVPRSGRAVMTSNSLGRTVNDDEFRLDGGTNWNDGASISLSGKNRRGAGGYIALHSSDGSNEKEMRLYPNGTWIWEGQAVQLISDQRFKQQITEIDNALLDAWEDVNPVQFKYNDAVNEKGNNARLHTGYVVQQIDSACKSHNVDISEYGLYCHEEYPEETEEVEVEQKDGTKIKERKVIREASEHYSLRYTEALIVECAYLRKKNKDLQEQLNALSERLEKLENR